ncbi:MAG: MFS transporter, partial [Candidatus Bathyarchaeia archaeon]
MGDMKAKLLLNIAAINILDAFVTGAYTLAVPLLMVKRNISLTGIGLVFSAFPIAFLTCRMLFSSAADSIGFRKFFNLNAAGNLASALLYAASSSPPSFAVAKAAQGMKEAALWAVNRSAVYEAAENQSPAMASSTILFIRGLSTAVGALSAGFMISQMNFEHVFLTLTALSALIFLPARTSNIGQREKLTLKELFKRLDPRLVEGKTWRTSLVMSLYTAASTFAVGFVLPIFLHERGLGYWEVGVILASYTGIGALLIPMTIRATPSIGKVVYAQILLYLPAAALIPLTSGASMIAAVMIMALGESTSYITWESLISREAVGRENVSTTIGFLHVPSNLTQIPSYIIAGSLI